MKATIERAAFFKSLNHVQSVVERRNTIPILSNILIQASGASLSLTATDLDVEVIEKSDVSLMEDGAFTVPAHTLHDIVRKLPEGAQIQLDYHDEEARLTLSAGRSRFQLPCLPAEDFPALSVEDLTTQFDVPSQDLMRLIDQTKFAISTEETRYYLNGIYLHAQTDGAASLLRAVATDGHRLARVQLPLPSGAADMPGVIVPRKAILELRRLLDDAGDAVHVSVSEAKIRFDVEGTILTSKLIDGTFPDYSRVIPVDNDKVLNVEGHDLAQAVDRVATISTEKSRAIKLSLEDGRITLAVNNPESGSASEELSVDYTAPAMEIGFNSKYLLDILGQINGGVAKFVFADASSPTIISDAEDEEGRALFVLMPMRV